MVDTTPCTKTHPTKWGNEERDLAKKHFAALTTLRLNQLYVKAAINIKVREERTKTVQNGIRIVHNLIGIELKKRNEGFLLDILPDPPKDN